MRICKGCGAFIGSSSKHMRRHKCKHHKRIMETRRIPE